MAPKPNNESNLQLELKVYRDRLRCLFAVVKFLIFSIAILSALFLIPYNSSISILISKWPSVSKLDDFLRFFLVPFASWDGAYFLKIAMEGYTNEPNYAFFPLFPLLIRIIGERLFGVFSPWLSLITRCMIAGVLISFICHGLSARLLFWITMEMFGNAYFAFLSTAFFILNPASAYLTSIYSESLFGFLFMSGLYLFITKRRALSSILWCLAGLTRSNGILLPIFYVADYFYSFRYSKVFSHSLVRLFRMIMLTIVCIIGHIGFQYYGYMNYCHGHGASRPWCNNLLPSIYNFVQERYWNVGLLKYYKMAQIPNFIIALPMILISALGTWTYFLNDPARVFTFGIKRNETSQGVIFLHHSVLPHIILWSLLLKYTVWIAHVQIITRLLAFQPVLYWFLTHLYGGFGGRRWQRPLILIYIGLYGLINVALFFNYYPPA